MILHDWLDLRRGTDPSTVAWIWRQCDAVAVGSRRQNVLLRAGEVVVRVKDAVRRRLLRLRRLLRGGLLNRWWRRWGWLRLQWRRILSLGRMIGEFGGGRKPSPDGCVSVDLFRLASHVIWAHSVREKGPRVVRTVRTLICLLGRNLGKSGGLMRPNR